MMADAMPSRLAEKDMITQFLQPLGPPISSINLSGNLGRHMMVVRDMAVLNEIVQMIVHWASYQPCCCIK